MNTAVQVKCDRNDNWWVEMLDTESQVVTEIGPFDSEYDAQMAIVQHAQHV